MRDIQESEIPFLSLTQEETWKDVQFDPELSPSQLHSMQGLCSQYADVLTDLPRLTKLGDCELKLSNSAPVRVRPYPIPHSQEETVKAEVESMLKMGVIERTASPYSAPIVLVRKKDGNIRFCVDYRRLNKILEFDGEPMPDAEQIFANVASCQYFTKLDLTKGYWQIPMASSSKAYTAFSTPQGQFQWLVMPFGLKTAGAVFSRVMRKLLAGVNDANICNCMDDVLLSTPPWEEHVLSLDRLLAGCREANLSVRPTKCFLGCREISFLGHFLGRGNLSPEEDKVDKIRKAPRPTTKKELRSFLGLVGYYRKFVANYSKLALPLTDKTKAKQPDKLQWDETAETSFQQLKEAMCSSPILKLPDCTKPFVLRTDASGVGLGAALLQTHGDDLLPVAYASKKLSDAERRYHTVELECYAVVWGIRRFYPYLYGRRFTVQSDRHPLTYLQRIRPVSRRLMG